MEIIERRVAHALRRIRFYTGKLCKYGHDSERYVSTGGCLECVNPKALPAASLPDPVESYTLPNGRILQRMTRDYAASIGWTVYFTGQPCDHGHIIERYVKSGLCIECTHPTVYGPDMNGLPPFQPKPPLRVPIGTPLSLYARIAELIQAEIPRIAAQVIAESGLKIEAALEVQPVYGMLHRSVVAVGGTLWLPMFPHTRGETLASRPAWMRAEAYEAPWYTEAGYWYAVVDRKAIPIAKEGMQPTENMTPDPQGTSPDDEHNPDLQDDD